MYFLFLLKKEKIIIWGIYFFYFTSLLYYRIFFLRSKEKLGKIVFGVLKTEIFGKRVDTVANNIYNKVSKKLREEKKNLKKLIRN